MPHNKTIPILLLTTILTMLIAGGTTTSAQTVSFLSVSGTWVTDSSGNPILLRGVDYPGYANLKLTVHTESDYMSFTRAGFNVVRLPISWAHFEPVKGKFDISLLWWSVDRDVAFAKQNGLHLVLDMHQYFWAEKWGGDGTPGWAVQQYPANDLGLREAVSDFWTNTTLQDHLINVWRNIASYYANEPTIAGYDLLNEPWIYTSIDPKLNQSNVDAYFARTIAAIRSVDKNHIIFLEPSNTMRTVNTSLDNKVVWEPHFYTLSFFPEYYPQNVTLLEADLAAKYQMYVLDAKVPMWIGEFGAFMKDNSADTWLEDAKTLFDKYQLGWAWWAYPQDTVGGVIPDCLQSPVTTVTLNQTPQPLLMPITHFQNLTEPWFLNRPGHKWVN